MAPERAGAADFTGQVVLVADACDVVGAQIGRAFAARGAAVALCGANAKSLDLLVGEIAASGGQAIMAVAADGAAQDIPAIVARVQAQFGKIDILVNNPGDVPDDNAADLAVSAFSANVEAMLTRSFSFLHEVLPAMRARRYGRIINIYNLAYLGLPGHPSVAAAHAGLFGLTRSVALEAAAEGVTINAVVKGDIAPPDLPADEAEKIGGRIPVKRPGLPADVLHGVNFFALPAAAYVTGQTLFVCGGKSAYFSMSV
jgi:3-oxoacyl-[acyl-carrier protein] reductase/2-[hydroxy(phenyl)methyl]-succinyl-CoA dehydrogenase BbsC subunit